MLFHTPFDRIRSAIAGELTAALKARDRVVVGALRAALGVLDNATAVPQTAGHAPVYGASSDVAGRPVTPSEIETLLLSEAQERAAAAVEYRRLEQPERAERLAAEARAIRACLKHLAGNGQTAGP
jgi:hypothetical protein